MTLGEKITEARKKKGMSQIDLADAMSVSRQSVSKWETGESNPEISKLSQLAEILGVSLDWLLSNDEEESKQSNSYATNNSYTQTYPSWIEHLPNSVLSLIKQHGWIYGAHTALSGLFVIAFGLFIRAMSHKFIFGTWGLSHRFDINNWDYSPFWEMNEKSWQAFSAMTFFVLFLGLATTIFGLVLAIALKKWGQNVPDPKSRAK